MTLTTTTSNAVASLISITVLMFVHLFVRELRRVETPTRNAILSAGAGASLAYVLMRILPKLADKQETLMASLETGLRGFLVHHVYLMATVGLVVVHGISRIETYSFEQRNADSVLRYRATLIATVVGYGAYSFLISYLIVNRLELGLLSLTLITLSMGALFLGSDYGLYKYWPEKYDGWIRWVLATSLLSGGALGVLLKVSPNIVALWYAFLAGMMLITTIQGKLAVAQRSSFWFFLLGVIAFSSLFLILENMPKSG